MALSDASPYKKEMTTKSASTELYPLVQELSLSPPRVDTTSNVTSSSPPPSAPSHPKGDATTGSTTEATTTSVTSDWFCGPSLITFDGDQTLYSDGENFESNPVLANYLYLLLTHGVTVAVVTAAGYEYQTEKYELRLSGLLRYFEEHQLAAEDCDRFYLMGGECNYLLKLGPDWMLHPVKEWGPGGWLMVTRHKPQTVPNRCVTLKGDAFAQAVKKNSRNVRTLPRDGCFFLDERGKDKGVFRRGKRQRRCTSFPKGHKPFFLGFFHTHNKSLYAFTPYKFVGFGQ